MFNNKVNNFSSMFIIIINMIIIIIVVFISLNFIYMTRAAVVAVHSNSTNYIKIKEIKRTKQVNK